MGQRFVTATVPPKEQRDYWQEVLCSRFQHGYDVRSLARRPQIDGVLEARPAGGLELSDILGDPVEVVRTPRHIVSTDPEVVGVLLLLSGRGVLEQNGRVARLSPGDLVLSDNVYPLRFCLEESYHEIILPLPRATFLARTGARAVPSAVRCDGQRGIGALFGSFLRTLYEQAEHLDAESAAVAAEQAMSLLTLAFGRPNIQEEDEPPPATLGRLRQIQAYIEAHLGDPELSPARVAAANRVSLRYLYKLFATADRSVSEWIRDRRLVRCAQALASPAFAGRSIAEIAFAWGFNDLSHFSRTFKRRFGMSPRDYRRAAPAAREDNTGLALS